MIITDKGEPQQVIRGNSVTYIAEGGWEDPNPICYVNDYRKTHKNNEQKQIHTKNNLFNVLINRYIGLIFFESPRHIQKIFLEDALKQFQQDMILKYGSLYNYLLDWLKRRGFKSDNEYKTHMAKINGFESRYDLFNHWAKKKGFKSYNEQRLNNLNKRGFKNQREYRNWLCKKWGVKNYTKLLKLKRQLKLEGLNTQPKSA